MYHACMKQGETDRRKKRSVFIDDIADVDDDEEDEEVDVSVGSNSHGTCRLVLIALFSPELDRTMPRISLTIAMWIFRMPSEPRKRTTVSWVVIGTFSRRRQRRRWLVP